MRFGEPYREDGGTRIDVKFEGNDTAELLRLGAALDYFPTVYLKESDAHTCVIIIRGLLSPEKVISRIKAEMRKAFR